MSFAADTPYSWSFDPAVLASIALVGGVYGWRVLDLRSPGVPRATRIPHAGLRAVAFAAGLLVLAAALVSPIDTLGERRLFSVHMAQHLLIMDIAPILLLLGLSRPFLRPVIRRARPLESSLGFVAHPLTALCAMVIVVWLWHLPAMYELALRHPLAHALEHMTFFGTGIAFWWYVLEPVPPRHRLDGVWPVLYVAAAKLLFGALGLVLAFAPSAFYDTYKGAPRTWGMTALEDQNVGGFLMMLEQTLVLAVFFAIAVARMIERSERTQRRRERFGA